MKSDPLPLALFRMGHVVQTMNAANHVPLEELQSALRRHHAGDWGDLPDEDRQANNQALETGDRLLSAYQTASGLKFWIITEADRSTTTILLPEDY